MRLNGGEFLLDFTALSLTDSASSVTISNKEILSALSDLKVFINNQLAIKPVWVKFIDDDTDEIIVARGEIRKAIGDLEFDIFISSKGHSLSIHVEFTQMVDADSNPLDDYYIASGDASYVYTSAQPIYEEIVDKDGHKRFLEGDVEFTADDEGIETLYGKWSLSGSHLLIVLCLSIPSGKSIAGHTISDITNIPEWILDKITPLFSGVVDTKTFKAFNTDYSTQDMSSYLYKVSVTPKKLYLYNAGTFTAGKDRVVRIAYDLLIDNE